MPFRAIQFISRTVERKFQILLPLKTKFWVCVLYLYVEKKKEKIEMEMILFYKLRFYCFVYICTYLHKI